MSRSLMYTTVALLGGAAGALVGLMVAPDRGRRTRRRLSRRVAADRDALVRTGHRAVGGLSEYLYDQFEESKRKLARVSA